MIDYVFGSNRFFEQSILGHQIDHQLESFGIDLAVPGPNRLGVGFPRGLDVLLWQRGDPRQKLERFAPVVVEPFERVVKRPQETECHILVFRHPRFSDPYAGELIAGNEFVGVAEVGKSLLHRDETDRLRQYCAVDLLRLQRRPAERRPPGAYQVVIPRVDQPSLFENVLEYLGRAGLETGNSELGPLERFQSFEFCVGDNRIRRSVKRAGNEFEIREPLISRGKYRAGRNIAELNRVGNQGLQDEIVAIHHDHLAEQALGFVEAFVARDVERRVTESGAHDADFDRSLRPYLREPGDDDPGESKETDLKRP